MTFSSGSGPRLLLVHGAWIIGRKNLVMIALNTPQRVLAVKRRRRRMSSACPPVMLMMRKWGLGNYGMRTTG